MNVPFELSAFVDRLASDAGVKISLALVHFLWQGVLIAACAAVLMRVAGRTSSQRRYLIGVVAMAAMAVLPIVTFCLVEVPDWSQFIVEDESRFDLSSLDAAELELLAASFDATTTDVFNDMPPLPPRPLTWPERIRLVQPYALMIWLCGTGLFALRLGVGLHASWRFGRGHAPLPEAWRDIAARVASRLGVASPRIFVSERVVEAVAVGLLKPMVLLPAAWIGNVPPDVLEAVLAHEIAHLRRYDLWVNLLQRCVEAALFYHPAVWWLSRRIRQEREYCCDELAATVVSGRAAYARALEYVATERVAASRRVKFAAALAAGMGGSRMALLDRVRRVLGNDVKPHRGTWLSEGLLALTVPAALWACIATVSPNVATADDAENATQKEEDASAETYIGDVEYWQERGVEPGMITVVKDGELLDLATGESIDPDQKTTRPFNLNIRRPVPQPGVQRHQESDDVAKALRELREEMQSLRKELDELRGKPPAAAKPAEIDYRIRKLPPDAPKPPSATLPPAAGGAPAPPPLPASPNANVERLIRVMPLEIDGKTVNVIVEEFREGEGPAKEIQLRLLRRSSDVTIANPALSERREWKSSPDDWKAPPGTPQPRGEVLSVQRVEPLEIDGKKVNVIIEEFPKAEGPATRMQLRILKQVDPQTTIEVSPADAESAALRTRIRVEQKRVHEEAERAEQEAVEAVEQARAMLEKASSVYKPHHPAIDDAEARLRDAQQQLERQSSVRKALEARRSREAHDTAREMNDVMDRAQSEAKAIEAADKMRRQLEEQKEMMQRQIEEQKKLIEELQKKLEGDQKERERQGAALKPLIEEYNEKINARDFAAAVEIAKKAKEVAPSLPETITLLYKAKVLLEEQRSKDARNDASDRSEPAMPDPTDDEGDSSARIDIPALMIDTATDLQKTFSFYVGFAR